jgi:hypothetical protein
MTDKPSNVVELHDRITITLSPAASKLIRAEIERQVEHEEQWGRSSRPAKPPQTPEELVNYVVRVVFGDESYQARQGSQPWK